MTRYGITIARHRSDFPVTEFGREVLGIWSGSFYSQYEGKAVMLPKGDGYMVTIANGYGAKIRVECPAPRTDDKYEAVDAAINAALNAAYPDTIEVVSE